MAARTIGEAASSAGVGPRLGGRGAGTPGLLVDLNAVERNVSRLQGYADEHGLALVPHVKTHKCAELMRLQLNAGAAGIACQTISEAEAMAEAGADRITLCRPALAETAERAAALASRVDLSVALDSQFAAETLAAAAAATAGSTIDVLIECDTGGGRAGVQVPAQAAGLAQLVDGATGLRFAGLLTHPTPAGAGEWLAAAKEQIEGLGIEVARVSIGGTPTALEAHRVEVATELRAGTYALGDRSGVVAGYTSRSDCALRVRATVLSRPTVDRAILDTGSKSLSSDLVPGGDQLYGEIDEYPRARIVELSEEHGRVEIEPGEVAPEVGEIVTILPNHACVTMNLHERVVVRRGDTTLGEWRLVARSP